ncbi:tRNA-dihydrouridine(20) synthase [nad(p)+]-like protein [Plakobranchus ocellatus]|uniref:tRNA-dihydrouridine(20) synthase [nad(P)+]-like protein n=1 Tax=Plakobranchus ocellatus TaxID=259542 RepID=A0AAV4ACM9_9GAST|nr:tRNA-dihydrouridine(20) synthase [nad(p)+]-like protein [Plakobranchus ocellatus]
MNQYRNEDQYRAKIILAPMVRVGTLPMRLLALDYGADLVYCEILTELVSQLSVPVTCKIRVLPQLEDTLKLAKLIESTGVSALAVHGRTKTERSRDPNRDHYIKAIAEALEIPVIANGGSRTIKDLSDIEQFRKSTGAASIMVARAAEWNCSVFRKEGPLPYTDVMRSYLTYAFKYDNNEINTKYCVLQILHDKMTEAPEADRCLAAKSLQDFANIWELDEDYQNTLLRRREREKALLLRAGGDYAGVKRKKTNDGLTCFELPVRFDKRLYSSTMTPKQILNNWSKNGKLGKPIYKTEERATDRCFHSSVQLGDKIYTNPYWEKSKQLSEQSAAICCLVVNGQDDSRLAEPENESEQLRRKWRVAVMSPSFENREKQNDEKNDHNSCLPNESVPDSIASANNMEGQSNCQPKNEDTCNSNCMEKSETMAAHMIENSNVIKNSPC